MKLNYILYSLLISIIALSNGCVAKYGIYNIKEEGTRYIMDTKNYYTAVLSTPPFINERFDADFGWALMPCPKLGTDKYSPRVTYTEFYTTIHFYPIETQYFDFYCPKPYLGTRFGYFDFGIKTFYKGQPINWSSLGPNSQLITYLVNDKYNSIVHGFFPSVDIGILIPFSEFTQNGFIIEFRHDFKKYNENYNYNGNIISFGLRLTPYDGWY